MQPRHSRFSSTRTVTLALANLLFPTFETFSDLPIYERTAEKERTRAQTPISLVSDVDSLSASTLQTIRHGTLANFKYTGRNFNEIVVTARYNLVFALVTRAFASTWRMLSTRLLRIFKLQ